ncbi:MAG: lipocalin family protein [Chitinophagaceae bacterium]|nr:lipocalin family protein [Chitinophagaceae bacterium]
MQKHLWIPCLAVLVLSLVWASCSKNSSGNNNNYVTLLTKGTWKFDTSGIDLDKNGTVDQPDPILEPCFKDNTFVFNKDSTVVMDEGADKCSTNPQTGTYSWSITNGNPAILKSDVNPILAQGLKIYTLTDTKLTVYKDTTYMGVSFWYIMSLKH